ncbi:hypothetical protein RND71_003369 [Anisodus tanguticus]|uniref:Uncharacterized protein n=1 Tax=Anisodus tanguticus TaxID=243964 RepID=A0AAE1SWN1_9SOLA|nr:hypothetical protein RND71_003369 [Anisodus tanguticus]
MSESSPISSALSPSQSSYSTQQTGSTVIASESYEQYQNQSSLGEICSDAVINNNGMSDTTGRTEEVIRSLGLEMSQALRRLEEQLSLNDDSIKEIDPLYADAINGDSLLIQMQGNSNSVLLQHHSGESSESHHQHLTQDGHMWKDMLDYYGVSAAAESQTKYLHKLDENSARGLACLVILKFMFISFKKVSSVQKGDSSGLGNNFLEKSKASEDSWSQVIESLLFGTSRSMITIDWLLQELLKDKFQQWLSCKLQQKDNQIDCSLSKKEQGIIHMVAGLGFE